MGHFYILMKKIEVTLFSLLLLRGSAPNPTGTSPAYPANLNRIILPALLKAVNGHLWTLMSGLYLCAFYNP